MAHDHNHAHHPLRLGNLLGDLLTLTVENALRWKVESARKITAEHRQLKLAFEWPILMVFDQQGQLVDEVEMCTANATLESGRALWNAARTGPHTPEQRSRLLQRLSMPRTPAPPVSRSSSRAGSSHAAPSVSRTTGDGDEAWYARPTRIRPPRL